MPPALANDTSRRTVAAGAWLIAHLDESGGPSGYVLEAAGRRPAFVDANGHAWTTPYDVVERVINEISPKGGRITTTYDSAGNRRRLYEASHIDQSGAAARSGWLGRSEYAYNAADELLTVTPQAPASGEVTLAQQVSPPLTGAAYALTLPLRTSFVYTLDTATLDLIGASGAWDEDNAWQLALAARDDAGIVSTLATTTWAAAGAGRVELTPPAPVTLDADATPRLGVSVSTVGTPPPLVGLAGTASLAGALKPTRYAYDANGNTVGIDGPGGPGTLTWDAENRLIGLDAPDGTETYTYDSTTSVPGKVTGLRRSKTTAAGTTHFVWDQQNLLAELDGELERLVQYTGWPGVWGGLASARAGGASQYLGFDLSANTRSVFDALGAVDQTAWYSAFGPMLAGNLSGAFRYGGEVQYYSDARWLQVRARELEVLTGRWLSRDPLCDTDHPWQYLSNRPVGETDASGLISPAVLGCALACACAGAYVGQCLADAWQGPPGRRLARFRECMGSTWQGLPTWGQAATAACFVGCGACLYKLLCALLSEAGSRSGLRAAGKGASMGICTYDQWKDIKDAVSEYCKSGERGCKHEWCLPKECPELKVAFDRAVDCLGARMRMKLECFPCDNASVEGIGHGVTMGMQINAVRNCVKAYRPCYGL